MDGNIYTICLCEWMFEWYVCGPWFHGSVVPWFRGSMVPWFHGSVVPWFRGSMVPWFYGSMVPWFHDSMVPWFHDSVVPWFHGSMVPVAVLPQHWAAIGRLNDFVLCMYECMYCKQKPQPRILAHRQKSPAEKATWAGGARRILAHLQIHFQETATRAAAPCPLGFRVAAQDSRHLLQRIA